MKNKNNIIMTYTKEEFLKKLISIKEKLKNNKNNKVIIIKYRDKQ